MESAPALIQSNKGMVNDFTAEELSSKKTPMLIIKDTSTVVHPTNPIIALESIFLPKPISRNPIKGNKGTNQIKSIIIYMPCPTLFLGVKNFTTLTC